MNALPFDAPTPRSRCASVCLCFGLLFTLSATARVTAQPRVAPPGKADQTTAFAAIKEVYAADYAKRTRQDRLVLIEKLRQAAGQEDNAANRYALLSEAVTLSGQCGSVINAMAAADELGRWYDVDVDARKSEALVAIARALSGPQADGKRLAANLVADANRDLLKAGLPVAERLLETGQGELAETLLAALQKSATQLQALADHGRIKVLLGTARLVREDHKAIRDAEATLAKDPDNMAANLVVGRLTCLRDRRWPAGAALLAKGGNTVWAVAGRLENDGPATAEARVAFGDAWWAVAATEKPVYRARVYAHACEWYDRAMPELTTDGHQATADRLTRRVRSVRRAPDLTKLIPAEDRDMSRPPHMFNPSRDDVMEWGNEKGVSYLIARKPGWGNGPRLNIPDDTAFAFQVVGRTPGPLSNSWSWEVKYEVEKGKDEVLVNGAVERGSTARVGGVGLSRNVTVTHPAIKPLDQFNTLLVIQRTSMIEVYVNGEQVVPPVALKSEPLRKRHIRVWLFGKENVECRAEFTRLTIWTATQFPDPPLPQTPR